MSCTPAPACKAVLAQADALAPKRSDKSDGICASPKHTQQNPTSDHETGDAVDLTHDPANGCDVDKLFGLIVARRDPRVKYLIRSKRILRSYAKPGIPAWTWAAYTGSNPHDKHGHISIVPGARNDTSPWFVLTDTEEPDVNDRQNQILENLEKRSAAQSEALADVQKRLERIEQAAPNTGSPANAKWTVEVKPA